MPAPLTSSALERLFATLTTTEPVGLGTLWRSGVDGSIRLSVGILPAFTDQPDSVTVAEGATATFTTAISNYTSLQWYRNDGVSFSAISGETGLVYTKVSCAFAEDDGDQFKLIAIGPGGTTESSVATLTVTLPAMPSGAVGLWDGDDYVSANNRIPNSVSVVAASTRLNRFHRRYFAQVPWGRSLVTAVDSVIAGPDGLTEASSLSCASGSWYCNASVTQSFGTQPAGQYTLSVWVKRNAGTDQTFKIGLGSAVSGVLTATSAWQQFTLTTTQGSSFNTCWILSNANAAAELYVVDMEVFAGASAGAAAVDAGHLYLSPAVTMTGSAINFVAANTNGAIHFPSNLPDSTRMTIVGMVRKTAASSGFVPILAKFNTANDYLTYSGSPEYNANGPNQHWGGTGIGLPALTATSYALLNKGWHSFAYTVGPGIKEFWIDGARFVGDATASGSVTLRDFLMATINTGAYGQGFQFRSIAAWNRLLSDAEIQMASSILFSQTAVAKTAINLLCAEGDSITTGATLYWGKYLPNIDPTKKVLSVNQAAGGNTMALNVGPRGPNLLKMAQPAGSVNQTIATLLMTNGLTSDTALFLSEIRAWADPLRAAGIKVAIATLTPRTDVNYNTYRNTVNPIIRTWPGLGYCDAVIDFAADSTMGTDAAASDTALYPDGGHPSDAGQVILETVYRPVINGMLI